MSDAPHHPQHDPASDAASTGRDGVLPEAATESTTPPPAPPAAETVVDDETVAVRRAPRYGRFMLVGVALGVLVALILTFAFPENPEFDRGQVFGFLLLGLGAIGAAFGAAVALIFDRVLSGRAGTAVAEHEHTRESD